MPTCRLCQRKFRIITNTHCTAVHGLTLAAYSRRFGRQGLGFVISPNRLPKTDPRFLAWKESLKKRPPSWCKGYTKDTHPGVAKISETFRRKKIDNFAKWREHARTIGRIPKSYPPLVRDKNLAFLIGLSLGDGHIQKFPRTESLTIALGTDKPLLWQYAARIIEKVFVKRPSVAKRTGSACMIIRIFQQQLSNRLGIPAGRRTKLAIKLPPWIWRNRPYLIACLKGLSSNNHLV